MPETATQKGTEEKKKGDFTWGRDKQGNLLVDGVVVEKYNELIPQSEEEEGEEEPQTEGASAASRRIAAGATA